LTVRVNGRRFTVERGETVESLLERLGLLARYCLVERNGEPVARETFDRVHVDDGDRLVVARPTAGG
jgi:thiamine biosynthesis protein ThiS